MHLKKLAKEEIMMTNYSKKTNFKGYEKLKTESLTFQELVNFILKIEEMQERVLQYRTTSIV